MKHIILTGFLLFVSLALFAQKDFKRFNVSAQIGTNLYQVKALFLYQAHEIPGEYYSPYIRASASFTNGFAFDYRVIKPISIGLAFAQNTFDYCADNVKVSRNDGTLSEMGNVVFHTKRYNVAFRTLIHYGKPKRLDMYSGFRVGINFWESTYSSTIEDTDIDDYINIQQIPFPTFAIIPFGLRYHYTENMGLGFETHIGPPYTFNILVDVQF